jgi:ribosome-associated protein
LTSQAHVIKTQMPSPPPALDELLKTVHGAVENLKAKDVVEIDVRGKSSVTDYMVIASGTSTRHVKSIADEVVKFAKNLDVMPLGVEGEREAEWVLVDLGDVIVHVMLPRVREFYALERLWTVGDQPPDGIDEYGDDGRDRAPRASFDDADDDDFEDGSDEFEFDGESDEDDTRR